MNTQRWQRIDEVFQATIVRPPGERADALARACNGDDALRAEVESLLAADRHATHFIELPAFDSSPRDPEIVARPAGERIGHYAIRGVLGRGGTSIVYEAEQDSPSRVVALKVMRAMPCEDELTPRLFRREGQALARLEHPSIAAIHEAGRSDDGWYYFAMERVQGNPLTQFAQQRQLDVRARLDLFVRVCDAVHYAHQRGVIHRDLKPLNILVNDDGQPKILDFGLARITDPDANATQGTEPGSFHGTLAYTSPEQAQGRADAIDVRSDVYSLGVILYELLTGRVPIDVKGVPLPAAVRMIAEQAPRPPSASVQNDPRLARQLRGDLETIALKALHKDADHRYGSAAALGDDIRHHLSHEPITARRDSGLYVLRTTLRRYRAPLTGIAALLVVLAVALAVALVARNRAAEDRDRKERVLAFLTKVLGSADPLSLRRTPGGFSDPADPAEKVASLADLLREAVRQLDQATFDPLVEAELRHVLGNTLTENGKFGPAIEQLRKAVELRERHTGSFADATLESTERLAHAHFQGGDKDGALALARPAYEVVRAARGPADPMTRALGLHVAHALEAGSRFDEARAFLSELADAAAAQRGKHDAQAVELRFELARILSDTGRPAEALAINRDLQQSLADRPEARLLYLCAAEGVGDALYDLGRYREAAEASRESVNAYIAMYGENHPITAYQMVYLARSLGEADQLAEARAIGEKALECQQRFGGNETRHYYRAERALARILARLDTDLKRAEDLARHATAGFERICERGHYNVLYARDALAVVLQRRGQLDEAEAIFLENVERGRSTPEVLMRTRVLRSLGLFLEKRGKRAEARDQLLAAWESADRTLGADTDIAGQIAGDLGRFYQEWDAAEPGMGHAEKAAEWQSRARR